jgi:hypothetical protein
MLIGAWARDALLAENTISNIVDSNRQLPAARQIFVRDRPPNPARFRGSSTPIAEVVRDHKTIGVIGSPVYSGYIANGPDCTQQNVNQT